MPLPMPKKITSYLRGLTETRAYAAGEVERYQRILAEVQEYLAAAQMDLAACDRLIKKYDGRLDPTRIEPVHANRRYGGYGKLRQAIIEILGDASPGELSTTLIAIELQIRFGIEFMNSAARKRWINGSVSPALRALVYDGIVERLHDPRIFTGEAGRWRLRSAISPSAAHLLKQLEIRGDVIDPSDTGEHQAGVG
jgi:hypothetical protein